MAIVKIKELELCKAREAAFQRCLFKYRQICRAVEANTPSNAGPHYSKLHLKFWLHFWAPEETEESLGLGKTWNDTQRGTSQEVNKCTFEGIRKFIVGDKGFVWRQLELCAVNNVC